MRRLFWVAVGAAAGVYAVRKVQRTIHAYSPSGLAARAGGVGATVKAFADEVRDRAAEREAELRDALGLSEQPMLSPGEAAELTDHPVRPRGTSNPVRPRGTPNPVRPRTTSKDLRSTG